jgi:hypothetical protein
MSGAHGRSVRPDRITPVGQQTASSASGHDMAAANPGITADRGGRGSFLHDDVTVRRSERIHDSPRNRAIPPRSRVKMVDRT